MYISLYLPVLPEGVEDPTREHLTELDAWEYIFSRMCLVCKELREQAINGDENGSLYPACSCEWCVLSKEDYENSSTFGEILESAGFRKVKI